MSSIKVSKESMTIRRNFDAAPRLQIIVLREAGADIDPVIRELCVMHILIREADEVSRDVIDLCGNGSVAKLHRAHGAPVAVIFLREGRRLFVRHALAVEIDPVLIPDRLVKEGLHEGVRRVLHAEAADKKDHAAENPEERHEAPGLVAEDVAQIPFASVA